MNLFKFKKLRDQSDKTPVSLDALLCPKHGDQSFKYVYEILKDKKIYIPTLEELNDPFESTFRNINQNGVVRYKNNRIEIIKTKLSQNLNKRILCLSATNKSTLLWSHYADSHKGICISFKVPECKKKAFEKVKYSRKISSLEISGLRQKSLHWRYEKEYRFFARDASHKYYEFNKDEILIDALYFGLRVDDWIINYFKQFNIEMYRVCLNDSKTYSLRFEKIGNRLNTLPGFSNSFLGILS